MPSQRGEEPGTTEADLVARLLAGDVDAFDQVVRSWSPAMLRVARSYVSTNASAEEIVQEAWLAVVRGLDRFEGRSTLRTWLFRIVTNQAKSRGVREARAVPWSSIVDDGTASVDPARFRTPEDPWPGHWTTTGAPRPWHPAPDSAAVAAELRSRLAAELGRLPERQRVVVTLRDVHGVTAGEVCETLGISAANQRVLLHRARARLRAALEDYYRGVEEAS